ncbi:hypothetical protein [Kineosporia babensis]|uniref:DUF2637 domain-containing protein n=1 Tax=Kineosporia babensis TaxID=499548 RepID=A0A9X1NFP9_9ACTN|nr:hypothetical protein [Kineosporia babensis]MCD5312976.1 hypothetical protein [Kineosporia babensis]
MTWLRESIHQVVAAIVIAALGAVSLAGSANHIVHVGAYSAVRVTDWMVWTVAGSMEVLAAFATWEMRSRSGWDRLVPSVVALLSIAFIILANLAAAGEGSWAGQLPWAQAFMVTPPVSFLSVVLIAETSSWRNPRRRVMTRASRPGRQVSAGDSGERSRSRRIRTQDVSDPLPPPAADVPPGQMTREPNQRPGPDPAEGITGPGDDRSSVNPAPGSDDPSGEPGLPPHPGEDRAAAVTRWVHEGHRWSVIVQAGMHHFGVSVFDAAERADVNVVQDAEDRGVKNPAARRGGVLWSAW